MSRVMGRRSAASSEASRAATSSLRAAAARAATRPSGVRRGARKAMRQDSSGKGSSRSSSEAKTWMPAGAGEGRLDGLEHVQVRGQDRGRSAPRVHLGADVGGLIGRGLRARRETKEARFHPRVA
ncbi:MAG: hypothetical protein U1F87_14980 [Kiritimatiellia bacterium]